MSNQTSDNKRIAKNSILLYIRMIFMIVINLYTSRVVLRNLGVDDFGIQNVVGGVITILSFISGSLGGATSRFITFALGKNRMSEVKKMFGNIMWIHIAFSIVVLLLGETIGLWFVLTQLNIPIERYYAAIWVYQFSVVTSILGLLIVPYNATVVAHEKMSAFAYITVSDACLKLLIAFLLTIVSFDKLIVYSALMACIQLLDFVIYYIYCFRNFEETHSRISYDKKLFQEIFSYTGWTITGAISVFGYTQGLNILLNMFFGPVVNAARGIAVQVQNVANNFCLNFQMALNPQLTKSYAKNDLARMHELLIASSKFSVYLLMFLCVPLIIETETVLKLWLGDYPKYTVAFVRCVLILSILYGLSNPILVSVHSTGKIKKFQIVEALFLLSIVPVAWIMLRFFDVNPVFVFYIHISIEILTQIARIKIVLPMIELKISVYLQQVLLPIIKVLLIAPIAPLLFRGIFKSGFVIVSIVAIFSVLFCALFLGCTQKERSYIICKVVNKLKR